MQIGVGSGEWPTAGGVLTCSFAENKGVDNENPVKQRVVVVGVGLYL